MLQQPHSNKIQGHRAPSNHGRSGSLAILIDEPGKVTGQQASHVFGNPLDPLIPAEIRLTTEACTHFAVHRQGIRNKLRFNTVTLSEPEKAAVLAWQRGTADVPPRIALCIIQVPDTGLIFEADVVLTGLSATVVDWRQLGHGVQPLVTWEDCRDAENIFKQDTEVQRVCRERYGIKNIDEVACDPWYYGERFIDPGKTPTDGRFIQCFLYTRAPGLGEDNYYAHPLDLVVNIDMNARKVTGMWHQAGEGYQVPQLNSNYHRDCVEQPVRTGLKPLDVVQPEGPSWELDGNHVRWQQWSFRVGFHYREGLVLHQIGYEDQGRVRPVAYRASTVEIIVPYGDPRYPFNRKCAFDAMDYGLGVSANSLELGCDCLGAIKYFDGVLTNADGEPMIIKKAICMHEEDYGVLWKHTEWRNSHLETRRSRRLVVSLFATIANYEYGFFWYFYQDGGIEHQVKLTGILSTNGLSEGEGPLPDYGVLMAPHLNAQIHQHFFMVRLDMAVDDEDGGANLVAVEVNCESMPDGPANPYGVGFCATETVLATEQQAQRDVDATKSRIWKIKNPKSLNPMNGQPVAWKLVPGLTPPLYANPSSTHHRRGKFATKHLWVTPYAEGEVYPAGKYPLEPNPIGIEQWTQGNRDLVGKDLVLWHTMGVTHIPRCEDFPVMPCEYASFHLKPANFFTQNPGIALPPDRNEASVEVGCSSGCCGGDSAEEAQGDLSRNNCCASSTCRCSASCICTACGCRQRAMRAMQPKL